MPHDLSFRGAGTITQEAQGKRIPLRPCRGHLGKGSHHSLIEDAQVNVERLHVRQGQSQKRPVNGLEVRSGKDNDVSAGSALLNCEFGAVLSRGAVIALSTVAMG